MLIMPSMYALCMSGDVLHTHVCHCAASCHFSHHFWVSIISSCDCCHLDDAGAQCLMGVSPAGCGSDCSGAPLLAPLYVACNLGFNIAALNLLRAAGVRAPSAQLQGASDGVSAFIRGSNCLTSEIIKIGVVLGDLS